MSKTATITATREQWVQTLRAAYEQLEGDPEARLVVFDMVMELNRQTGDNE